MLRVRGLTQDDAHLFCTPEQVEDEFQATLDLVQFVLKVGRPGGLPRAAFAPRSQERQVRRQRRELAEGRGGSAARAGQFRAVLCRLPLGEAAFYGPKADFMVRDCLGREWQLGTVQLDYNLPERFQLEYIGADNHAHRPVMIHRAPFGSMERFVGVLDRALCRRVPALAGSGAGARSAPFGQIARLRARGRAPLPRSRFPRANRHAKLEGPGQNPRRTARAGPLHAGRRPQRGRTRRRRPPRPHRRRPGNDADDRRHRSAAGRSHVAQESAKSPSRLSKASTRGKASSTSTDGPAAGSLHSHQARGTHNPGEHTTTRRARRRTGSQRPPSSCPSCRRGFNSLLGPVGSDERAG